MKNLIKERIKEIIIQRGFRIIRGSDYLETILGIEELYKRTKFKDFPEKNKLRIKLISRLIGTGVHEAFHILYYLNKSLNLEGDVCEFGVAQGATSALISNEIRKTSKNIWLFDSFKGLPKPTSKDKLKDDIFNLGSIEKYSGKMSSPVEQVKKRLKEINFPFSRVKIIPGYVEKTLSKTKLPEKVCFAYLDFDFYEPTIIALNSLDKVLVKNGFLIVDDYDFFSTGIKTAVEEFLSNKKERYELILPNKEFGHFCILKKIKDIGKKRE